MQEIKGVFRNKLRERPFDFYVAFLIFIAGMYSIFNASWPESLHQDSTIIMINIVSAYMSIASLIVMISLLCNRSKRPVFSIMAEMWGWLAISAAATATFLMYTFMIATNGINDLAISSILDFIWLGLSLAAGFRSLDIYLIIRKPR